MVFNIDTVLIILEIGLLPMETAEAIKVLFNFQKTWAQCTFRLTWGQKGGLESWNKNFLR